MIWCDSASYQFISLDQFQVSLNLTIYEWIDAISYNQCESHDSRIRYFFFFTFPSPILIKKIEKSCKLKLINEKELKNHFWTYPIWLFLLLHFFISKIRIYFIVVKSVQVVLLYLHPWLTAELWCPNTSCSARIRQP